MPLSPEAVEIFGDAVSAMHIELPREAEFARLPEDKQREIVGRLDSAARYAEIVALLRRRRRESDTAALRSFAARNDDDDALREYQERLRARDQERRPSHV